MPTPKEVFERVRDHIDRESRPLPGYDYREFLDLLRSEVEARAAAYDDEHGED